MTHPDMFGFTEAHYKQMYHAKWTHLIGHALDSQSTSHKELHNLIEAVHDQRYEDVGKLLCAYINDYLEDCEKTEQEYIQDCLEDDPTLKRYFDDSEY